MDEVSSVRRSASSIARREELQPAAAPLLHASSSIDEDPQQVEQVVSNSRHSSHQSSDAAHPTHDFISQNDRQPPSKDKASSIHGHQQHIIDKISALDDTWIYELLSVLLSISCIVANAIILAHFDGKVLSAWRLKIQPNTVVSIFAVTAKASMIYPVAQCISQLKWLYFQWNVHPTSELQLFENASIGPWGSLLFLWHFKVRKELLATGLCFITIIALALDPFTQQIIDFPSRLVPSTSERAITTAALGYYRAMNLTIHDGGEDPTYAVDPGSQIAISSAVLGLPRAEMFTCTSGNCTFPEITTFAVCGSCNDNVQFTTTCISPTNMTCNMTTSSGIPVKNATGTFFKAATPNQPAQTLPWWTLLASASQLGELDDDDLSISKFAIWKDTAKQSITECAFRLCERVYPPFTVTSGINDAAKHGSSINELRMMGLGYSENSSTELNMIIGRENGQNYTVNVGDITGLFTSLILSFQVSLWSENAPELEKTPVSTLLGLGPTIYQSNITVLVEKIADRLTGYIRSVQPQRATTRLLDNATAELGSIANITTDTVSTISGIALHEETYIHIGWWWFALPVGLVFLTLVSLVVVIFVNRSRGGPVWKSSSLPYLYHTLYNTGDTDTIAETQIGQFDKVSQMNHVAEGTMVQLATRREGGLRLVTDPAR